MAARRSIHLGYRKKEEEEEDRISQLPDVLLHQIMSSMSPIFSVQICVLSKRWRYLWTSLPLLTFNLHDFSDSDASVTDPINQFLLRRDSSTVVNFCLDFPDFFVRASVVEPLICYALKHHVQQLHLGLRCLHVPIEFPSCFYSCQALTTLKLDNNYRSINLPKSLGLPSLKILHLVKFRDFDGNIFSTCPNLETLKLEDIRLGDIQIFNINTLNLKSLEFLFRIIVKYSTIWSCKVMIFAPKLTKFKFVGCAPLVCSTNNLTSLDEVDINLLTSFHLWFLGLLDCDEINSEYGLYMINMLNEFRDAKSLTLSFNTIEILSRVPDALNEHPSQFSNLKYLKLKADKSCKNVTIPACILTYFLKGSSLLKICW